MTVISLPFIMKIQIMVIHHMMSRLVSVHSWWYVLMQIAETLCHYIDWSICGYCI